MPKKKQIYRVFFHNQGKVYELYARRVVPAELFGFVEISDIIFGERSALLVDPSEERLKSEFAGVSSTLVPMHAVIRVDAVDREGVNKIVSAESAGAKVTPFPVPVYTPGGDGSPG